MRLDRDERLAGQFAVHHGNEVLNHIIDVDEVDACLRIVDLNRQIAGNVVAEGRYRRVVVGARPLTEHIGQTEQMHSRTMADGQRQQRLFSRALAGAVGIVQLRLDRGGIEHRHLATAGDDRLAQGTGQVGIAGDELLRVLRAIHAGQVEHEIGLCHQPRKQGWGIVAGKAQQLDILALG
ncbi:hypothetical protein D3C78_823660 [compost metagenome]